MKTWELILMSDLVKVGTHEEEGYDIIRELWYVVAVDLSGRRFAHDAMMEKYEAEERLALFILDGGVDGEKSWGEMYPVYGSIAYQDQQPEIVAAERRLDLEGPGRRIIGMRYDKNPVMAS